MRTPTHAADETSKLYIGLMSGTSMDAVDAALVDFSTSSPLLLATHGEIITPELRQKLQDICQPGYDEINRLGKLDIEMGRLFAKASLNLLKKAQVEPRNIVAIGSHGQTVRHSPTGTHPFTLQIGDPNIIAETTGIMTVADFRRRDMAIGGQGAPLVPAFHALVFRSDQEERIILNIGGIANVTLLPSDARATITGFDTGPGNALLDAWAQRHLNQSYDQGGRWGETGKVDPALLATLLSEPYFQRQPPKSTGCETFHLQWLEQQLDSFGSKLAPVDVQATLIELTARSIQEAIARYLPAGQAILVCGGGAHNTTLMARLRVLCEPRTVQLANADVDWIEAMAFAWFAQQTLAGRTSNLPAVTGAQKAVILGGIYPGYV